MIAFVDVQHALIADDSEQGPIHWQLREWMRRQIEAATSLPCELVRYTRFDLAWSRRRGVRAVFISGNARDWSEYDWTEFAPLQEVIRAGELPVMGFCGGHQFLALTLGGTCGALGPLAPGEPDPDPSFAPGMRKEQGILPVRGIGDDPLLAGLPNSFPVWQNHYWEVKELPPGFRRLAESDACAVQLMRHAERPWCGSQFHPERSRPEYPAGYTILRNFCQLYGLI